MKLAPGRQTLRNSAVSCTLAAVVLGAMLSTAGLAPQSANGTWKILIMGDHRGDNKAFAYFGDPPVTNGYTDGGMNKAVLKDLAQAARAEGPVFVLSVGDYVTKWQPTINGCDADTLLSSELAEWRAIWLENSGNLPIFPVRGNQEWSAPQDTWRNWIKTMPGIGSLRMCSPPGEEGLTYAFTHKNCLFVAIDEYASAISPDSPTIPQPTLSWLGGVFAASDRPHVFVYGHAPAYEVWDAKKTRFDRTPPVKVVKDGLPSPALVDSKGQPLTPQMEYDAVMNVRNPLWNLLGSERATYYCGHEHLYARGVANDAFGNLVRQVIIGNGGAPPPAAFPEARYSGDPFVESVAGASPDSVRYINNWNSPRITVEAFDNPHPETPAGTFGYIIVEIHGSHATAIYKAERFADDPNGFVELDRWSWKITE